MSPRVQWLVLAVGLALTLIGGSAGFLLMTGGAR
jgi:membrane protein implicated in regulation of membrane protease activity